MHDGLRVNRRDNVFGCHVEEQVRFNQFEALVDQGRRIDRDDRTHLPRRVRERLLRPHSPQLIARATAERAARRSQHEIHDLRTPRHDRRCQPTLVHARGQGLGDRRMLGVHRDNLAGNAHRILDERTADNERFLVRKRQARATPQSRERRR